MEVNKTISDLTEKVSIKYASVKRTVKEKYKSYVLNRHVFISFGHTTGFLPSPDI